MVQTGKDPILLKCFLMNLNPEFTATQTGMVEENRSRHSNKWLLCSENVLMSCFREKDERFEIIHLVAFISGRLKKPKNKKKTKQLLAVVCCGVFSNVRYVLWLFSMHNTKTQHHVFSPKSCFVQYLFVFCSCSAAESYC